MSWIMIMLVLSAAVLFWIGVAILAAFVVQLAILSLTERRLRGWAPVGVPALGLWFAGLNGSVLGVGGGGGLLLGWGLGWALYKFQKRRESHEKTDPDL